MTTNALRLLSKRSLDHCRVALLSVILLGLLFVAGCAKPINGCDAVPLLSDEALREIAEGNLPEDYPAVELYLRRLHKNCEILDG